MFNRRKKYTAQDMREAVDRASKLAWEIASEIKERDTFDPRKKGAVMQAMEILEGNEREKGKL